MLAEYRFVGVSTSGQMVQGTFSVGSGKEAKEHVSKLSSRYQIQIQQLERKKDFVYTIYLPGKLPIRKRQSAFSKEELSAVLIKMGYNKFTIRRVYLDLRLRPTTQDIMMFVKLSATMLRDKMTFGKILEMLAEEQTNRILKDALVQLENQLKSGMDGREAFMQHSKVFGRFPAFMLGMATTSGNMVDVFEATAKFMERDQEIRRNIKKALISPLFSVLATLGAVAYYVQDIFPSTAELFLKYGMPLPALTTATLNLSGWLQDWGWLMLLVTAGALLGFWKWKNGPMGRIWFDKTIIRLPLIGHLIHKSCIEIYFRVFATIYTGSRDNIENIKVSAEACRNAWMERQIKQITIPLMLKEGEAFVTAMDASGAFTKTTITRLRTGQETGNVLLAAQQIASFYEAETTYKLNNFIEYIQSMVALLIAIVISLLTIISAEIATISPPVGF